MSDRTKSQIAKGRPAAVVKSSQIGICVDDETLQSICEKKTAYKNVKTRKIRFESALDAYLWHGKINAREYKAGLKFYREYARSILKIKIEANGDGNHGDYEMTFVSTQNGLALLRQLSRVLSSKQQEVLIAVCVKNYRAGGRERIKRLIQTLRLMADIWKIKV